MKFCVCYIIICRATTVGGPSFPTNANVTMNNYIVKVRWHPLSNGHLSVLTSDHQLALFNLNQSVREAEQRFYLSCDGHSQNQNQGHDVERIISFEHGGRRLWEHFTIFYMSNWGKVYALLPVVPFHWYVHSVLLIDV